MKSLRLGFFTICALVAAALIGSTIGLTVWAANKNQVNHSAALHIAQLEFDLERLLRSVNEIVVTEGSSSSRKLANSLVAKLDLEISDKSFVHLNSAVESQWRTIKNQVLLLATQDQVGADNDDAMIALGKLTRALESLNLDFSKVREELAVQSQRTANNLIGVLATACVISGLGLILIAWLFRLRIIKHLALATRAAQQYATGNLAHALNLSAARSGEAKALVLAINAMRSELVALVGSIRVSSDQVSNQTQITKKVQKVFLKKFALKRETLKRPQWL